MKLQVMFVIAVVALFGALSAISVSAEPGDGVSDAPVRSDRVSDVQITDACHESRRGSSVTDRRGGDHH